MNKKSSISTHYRIKKITLRNGREFFRVSLKNRGDLFWLIYYKQEFETKENAIQFMEEKIKEDNENDRVIIKSEIIELS